MKYLLRDGPAPGVGRCAVRKTGPIGSLTGLMDPAKMANHGWAKGARGFGNGQTSLPRVRSAVRSLFRKNAPVRAMLRSIPEQLGYCRFLRSSTSSAWFAEIPCAPWQ